VGLEQQIADPHEIDQMIEPFRLDALINWIVAGAPATGSFQDAIAELARKMTSAGLPVDALGVYLWNFNPTVRGSVYYWTPRSGIKTDRMSHDEMNSPLYQGTVVQVSMTSGRVIRHRLGSGTALDDHPTTKAFKDRGYVEYLVCPLVAKHVPTCAIGVLTKQAKGFADDEVLAIRRMQAPLAQVVAIQTLHEATVSILSTYVGRNAGEKVLDGHIQRGDSEVITAVILFADLKNFTALSNSQSPMETISTLNIFFDVLDSAIRANGGETLKLIGDGLLAIFPTPDDITAQAAAAMGALSALDDARAVLANSSQQDTKVDFRAALHVGEVHYGNIGSKNRLDFTAIGPAVNLTARMLQASSEMSIETVCSPSFAPLAQDRAKPERQVLFKGFQDQIWIYSLN
jgi:adenylate cyclase